jgi:hypothetical protein
MFESRPKHCAIPTENFLCFPESLERKTGIVLRLRHDRLLPNPFQPISHPTIRFYKKKSMLSRFSPPLRWSKNFFGSYRKRRFIAVTRPHLRSKMKRNAYCLAGGTYSNQRALKC